MNENFAARAGRWSAQHRRKAIAGWLVFVVLAVVGGGAVGTDTLDYERSGVGDSGDAARVVDDAFPGGSTETVLVQARDASVTAEDPEFRAAVADVQKRLGATKHVRDVESPYGPERSVSEDGRSALVSFELTAKDDDEASDRVDATLDSTAAAQKANPELRIEQFGDASAGKALTKKFEEDFQKAEVTSLPITLVILVLAFGALVAAGIPLLLAITAVAATIGLIGPISQVFPVDESISSVILLIGLAVGVDYSLFYLRREREERAAGKDEEAALLAAAATSGRAVLISGFTVMIAMAGMYIAGAATFQSFATGTILVVAIAMFGSITVLPAVLSKLGDRVDKGRVPFLHRLRQTDPEKTIWARIVNRVLKRPLLSALVSGGLLLALATPTIGMDTRLSGIDTLPRDLEVMQTYDRIQAAFPGENIPANVVVEADDVRSGPAAAAIAELRDRAAQQPDLFKGRGEVDISPDRKVADVAIPLAGNGTDEESTRALEQLRGEIVPATVGAVRGAEANVTGITAETEDFNSLMQSRIAWVFAFVLSAAFVLLLVTFRSVVIPLTAIALNLLSVGAAYGLLVLVFQEGFAKGLIGLETTGPITAWLPLFLFVVLFGLSMDYHVFILTRVREAFDRGMNTTDAVASGIKSTAGTVTSAAAVMVGVFAIFATLSSVEFKQMGVGLAAAVLIDATVIRGVLLPATMKLLGDWNWYLPKWLEWLPRVTHEPAVEETTPPEREKDLAGV